VLGHVTAKHGAMLNVVYEKNSPDDKGMIIESHDTSEVFTPLEAAKVADDLLPEPLDGAEEQLQAALTSTLADPDKARELRIRLEAEAMASRMGSHRTDEELGVKTKEQLLGSDSKHGSNIWKISEMLEGIQKGYYPEGASNELELARASEHDLDLLPAAEATRIRQTINEVNREVLDELYDSNYVDFSKATAWEKNSGDHVVRKTIYPAVSGLYSFEEMQITPVDTQQQPRSALLATLVAGVPADLPEQGYTQVL
jgi:hypothetical protein